MAALGGGAEGEAKVVEIETHGADGSEGRDNVHEGAGSAVQAPGGEGGDVEFLQYSDERQLPDIMGLISGELSEPYSIYTYRSVEIDPLSTHSPPSPSCLPLPPDVTHASLGLGPSRRASLGCGHSRG
jgi:hypothetical protein